LYLLVVLGSGGHTKEMLIMMEQGAKPHPKSHRRYLVSSGDHMSLKHLAAFEAVLQDRSRDGEPVGTYDVHVVPRARRIHQSLFTTPFSAVRSLLCIVPALLRGPGSSNLADWSVPDVVVTNGPATGFFVCFAALCLRILGIGGHRKLQIVFIESWARIKSLSLTGKLLYATRLADLFLVQHDAVAQRYGVVNAGWLVLGGRQPRRERPEEGPGYNRASSVLHGAKVYL
jgi:beta-1,4-N-acetylglucosaminyltransferase